MCNACGGRPCDRNVIKMFDLFKKTLHSALETDEKVFFVRAFRLVKIVFNETTTSEERRRKRKKRESLGGKVDFAGDGKQWAMNVYVTVTRSNAS